MTKTMTQAVLTGVKTFQTETAPVPEAMANEVLVRVMMSGACASEIEPWQAGANAPSYLGHEVSGEVIGIGSGVSRFKPGDLVTGLFRKGFAEFAVTTEDKVAHIPDGIGMDHSFGEPIACAMSAARRTRVDLGDRIAVVGLGFMGLLMMQMLRAKGPCHIVGIDMRDDALAMGKQLGADEVVKPGDLDSTAKSVFPFSGNDENRGFDVVVEATGTQGGLTLAGELVAMHGFLSILGYHQGVGRDVDMQLWNYKAFDVLNAHERRADYRMDCMRRGLDLAASGRIDLSALTTHKFDLEHVGDAYAALEQKPAGFVKSVVMFDT